MILPINPTQACFMHTIFWPSQPGLVNNPSWPSNQCTWVQSGTSQLIHVYQHGNHVRSQAQRLTAQVEFSRLDATRLWTQVGGIEPKEKVYLPINHHTHQQQRVWIFTIRLHTTVHHCEVSMIQRPADSICRLIACCSPLSNVASFCLAARSTPFNALLACSSTSTLR